MIIDIEKDEDFIRLTDFLFSFDFEGKDIIRNQIKTGIVKKEKSEYAIVFYFYVHTLQKRLPARTIP